MDHLDVELGAFEGWVVELADVVEEIAGESAVGVDGGAVEAEVGVVLGDLLVDGLVVDGDRGQGSGRGILRPAVPLVEKRRRWMSSSVAAGILSLLMEMNWMRASSRERAVSPSLVKMTRMGSMPCWM